jgi:hypothetical protein
MLVDVNDPKAEAIDPMEANKIIAIKKPTIPMGNWSMMNLKKI